MRTFVIFALASQLCFAPSVVLAGDQNPAGTSAAGAPAAEKCEHGVKKTICTRCNPKLQPVFKAKGDWCAEHAVPESQCAKCHPELAQQGVK